MTEGRLENLLRRLASPRMGNNSGSILLITLWSICLLSVMAVSLGYGVRQKVNLAKRLDDTDRLRLISEAGIKVTIAELIKEDAFDERSGFSYKHFLSSNAVLFKDIKIGSGTCNICYNFLDDETGLIVTRYGLMDEESKININTARQKVLEGLFSRVAGVDEMDSQSIAASICDWRDEDSQLSIPLGSAEDSYYRNSQMAYEAKDSDFEVLEELLLVKGITTEIYQKVKGYITIFGNGKVNINTASRPILLTLGINRNIVEGIISYRAGEDGITGTEDDKMFSGSGSVVPIISRFYNLAPSELVEITAIAEQSLCTDSENFMIRNIAQLNNRKYSKEVVCIADKEGEILRWREF